MAPCVPEETRMRYTYERDNETYPPDARYTVKGDGIAYYVLGWQTEERYEEYESECWQCDGTGDDLSADDEESSTCSECEGTGKLWQQDEEPTAHRTGNVIAVMVGDDRKHSVDHDDLILLGKLDYCTSCGQVGCCHDGRDRSEEN